MSLQRPNPKERLDLHCKTLLIIERGWTAESQLPSTAAATAAAGVAGSIDAPRSDGWTAAADSSSAGPADAAAAAGSSTADAAAAVAAVRALDTCEHRNYVLYLGRSIPGGGAVSDVDLHAFLQVRPGFEQQ